MQGLDSNPIVVVVVVVFVVVEAAKHAKIHDSNSILICDDYVVDRLAAHYPVDVDYSGCVDSLATCHPVHAVIYLIVVALFL